MPAAPSSAPPPTPLDRTPSHHLRVLLACGLALITAHLGLLVLGNLAENIAGTLIVLVCGFGAVFVAGRQRRAPSWWFILGVAAILRFLLLPLEPTLSDDVVRYVWDGRVVAAGENPYRLAPDAPELVSLRDDLWVRLSHREVPTVYPPLALGFFSIAASVPAPILAWKTLLVLIDLGTCGLLLLIAARLGLPSLRTVWYAWNPLVTLEVAGMGHVDALGVAAVVAATWYLIARRSGSDSASSADPLPDTPGESASRSDVAARPSPMLAGVFAAAGVLAKLVPVVAVPFWSRTLENRSARSSRRFVLVVVAVLIAAALPVLWATGGVPPGLTTYGVSWEFNGPLYEPLWRLVEALGADDWVHQGLDRAKDLSGWHDGLNRFYPYAYPRFLAKLLLLGLLALVVALAWWRGRRWGVLEGTAWVLGTALLCSATFYPWYLLWVLPFAALTGARAWLLLSFSLPLAYLPQFTEIALFPWIFLLIWVPFACLFSLSGLRSTFWPPPLRPKPTEATR